MSLALVQTLLEHYGYALLLAVAIIEGPIVIVIASFIASLGIFNIVIVYGIGVAGDVIGDAVYYIIGRTGRRTFIPRFGHYIGITPKRLEEAESHYSKHLLKTLVFGKVTQAPIIGVIVTAGITRINFFKFIGLVFLITLPKVLVFTLLGYYVGRFYPLINHYLNWYLAVMWFVLVAAAVIYWFIRKHRE